MIQTGTVSDQCSWVERYITAGDNLMSVWQWQFYHFCEFVKLTYCDILLNDIQEHTRQCILLCVSKRLFNASYNKHIHTILYLLQTTHTHTTLHVCFYIRTHKNMHKPRFTRTQIRIQSQNVTLEKIQWLHGNHASSPAIDRPWMYIR